MRGNSFKFISNVWKMYFRESFLTPTKRYAYCGSSNVTGPIILQGLVLLEGMAMLESVRIGQRKFTTVGAGFRVFCRLRFLSLSGPVPAVVKSQRNHTEVYINYKLIGSVVFFSQDTADESVDFLLPSRQDVGLSATHAAPSLYPAILSNMVME